MRIGKFAEHNGLTIDTLRHYMELALIVPEKQGGHYFFDNRCQKDLDLVKEYKGMGFTLGEIKNIFLYKDFGQFTSYEDDVYYQSIYSDKFRKLEMEIEKLELEKNRLKQKIDDINERKSKESVVMGVDLSVLEVLQCITCRGSLTLAEGSISRNQIIDGRLSCSCGTEYWIQSGILMVENGFTPKVSNASNQFVMDYIHLTDAAYLENIQKGLQWGKRRLTALELSNKVVLELGTGVGFLLRTLYLDLPENCLYIAVERNLERQRFLKNVLEGTGVKRKILFVCADFMQIPISDQSVDIVLDHAGTSNYSFEHEEFLLGEIDHLIKEDAHLLSSFIVFKNFSTKSKIEPCYRDNFTLNKIKKNIQSLGYQLFEEKSSEVVSEGGRYEDYFVKGEEVFAYIFFGKR